MAKVEVKMPQMGESITEGTVLAWLKKPGEMVEVDEMLLEISTDKVDTEVPSPVGGVLVEVLVEEDDVVEVNTVIAVIDTEGEAGDGASEESDETPAAATAEDVPAEEAQAESAPEEDVAEAPSEEAAPAPSAPRSGGGATVDVVMPKMGESITEGTVIVWHKQPGDTVELDETILEIGTDKVDTEVPSPAAGIVQEVLVPEGETVEVGTVLATLGSDAPAAHAQPGAQPQQTDAMPQAPSSGDSLDQPRSTPANAPQRNAPSAESYEPAGPIPRKDDAGNFFSPLVRSIAETEGVSIGELGRITGSGRDGRLTKEDLLGYVAQRGAKPAPAPSAPAPQRSPSRPAAPAPMPRGEVVTGSDGGRVEIVEMGRMRQLIAEHMVRSKATSAHVTSFAEVDVTNLVTLRESNKAAFMQREGIKLTYTPFFVKAAVDALREHPYLNASVEGTQVHLKRDYHIGIAVALGKTGLLAPVLRDAGHMNVAGLAHRASDLAQRARSKQLNPDELSGGTFTVTNIGSLGSLMGTPVINQPQVGILAVGAIKKRPVVIEDPVHGDMIGIRSMMYASLSYDHRIVDGSMASSYLRAFTDALEALDPNGTV